MRAIRVVWTARHSCSVHIRLISQSVGWTSALFAPWSSTPAWEPARVAAVLASTWVKHLLALVGPLIGPRDLRAHRDEVQGSCGAAATHPSGMVVANDATLLITRFPDDPFN